MSLFKKYGLIISLLIIGLSVHLYSAFFQNYFADEVLSIFFANSNTFNSLLKIPTEVIHPNLFYLLIKVFFLFNDNLFLLRFLMFTVFLVSTFGVYLIGRQLKLTVKQALIFCVPFVFSVYILRMSYLIRMYGVAICLLTFSFLFFLKYLANPNKKINILMATLLDIIGFFTVYGYLLWFVIKSFILIKLIFEKKKYLNLLIISLLNFFSFLFFLARIYFSNNALVNNHIGWAHISKFYDLGLGIVSLMGGGLYLYFENFALIGFKFIVIGFTTTLLILLTLPVLIKKYLKAKNTLLEASLLSLFFIIFIWFVSISFQQHIFHIRQLFVPAIFLNLACSFFVAKNFNKVSAKFLLLIFLSLSLFHICGDYIFGQAYPAYLYNENSFEDLPVIYEEKDSEFLFHVCKVKAFAQSCLRKKSYINVNQLTLKEKEKFVIITDEPATFVDENFICQQDGHRLFKCELK